MSDNKEDGKGYLLVFGLRTLGKISDCEREMKNVSCRSGAEEADVGE